MQQIQIYLRSNFPISIIDRMCLFVCLFAIYCVFTYSTYFSKLPCRRVIVHSFVSFNVSEITLEKKLGFFISLSPTLYYLTNRDSVLKRKTIIRAWVKNHTLRWWSRKLVRLSVLNDCSEHSLRAWAMPPQFFIYEKSILSCLRKVNEVSVMCNPNSQCEIRKVIPYLEILIQSFCHWTRQFLRWLVPTWVFL